MKRYSHLFERVCAFDNLILAAQKAMRGKKNKPNIAAFDFNLEYELIRLQAELNSGAYQMRPYRCFYVYDPKIRYICAADIRDRVVHHAINNIMEPLFERIFIYDSYACRKGKGSHRAVKRLQTFSRKRQYFFKTDIKHFFASVDHSILKALLGRMIKDQTLQKLLNRIIDHPLPGQKTGKGMAIGNLTSQWWANLYLDRMDHFIKDDLGVKCYVRYMDDFIALANTKTDLHILKATVSKFLRQKLGLQLKESATFIAPVKQGIPFLGFRVFPHLLRLKRENLLRFRRNYCKKEKAYLSGKIDEAAFIRSVNSMSGHIAHADTLQMRRRFFFGRA